ncbi:MAG: hypothetical protein COB02_12250 [Candidatus Cloacimonadota bacterium]|nr:MAG: hypothetical protein COB02_12250 [Candidatus Cloacimonadota bacterium]
MKEAKNQITLDRTLLGICVTFLMFMYSQLDKKLDKMTYERDKSETKVIYREITKQNIQILNELTELRTTIKIMYKIGNINEK